MMMTRSMSKRLRENMALADELRRNTDPIAEAEAEAARAQIPDIKYLPLPDINRPFSRCKKTSALLKKQFIRSMNYVKRREMTGEGLLPPKMMDYNRIKCIKLDFQPGRKEFEGKDFGAIRVNRPPLTQDDFPEWCKGVGSMKK